MPYNAKLFRYGNGSVEIRLYDSLMDNNIEYDSMLDIRAQGDDSFAQILQNHKDMITEFKRQDREEKQLTYNPFTGQKEKLFDISDDGAATRSLYVSRNRTIQAIYKYARQCFWDYFVTLTFDPAKADRFDFVECHKKVKKWLSHQHDRFAPELKYLFVPEQHKNGAWHYHGLVADVDDMVFKDSGHVTKTGQKIFNLSGWHFGFSTATAVTDTDRVSNYITKYITKDLCEVARGSSRYLRSRNLGEPAEDEFLIEGDKSKFLEELVDSLGVDLVYKKRYEGLFPLEYLYYK